MYSKRKTGTAGGEKMLTGNSHTARFKAAVVRELLDGVKVPEDFGTRFGVAPDQVEQWKQHAAEHLDAVFTPTQLQTRTGEDSIRLSDGELRALLG